MNLQTLLEYLDLEEPSQFEYFENLADLTEADEEIMPEAVCPLFEGVDMEIFSNLLEDYFEDMLGAVPEDEMELYTLLDSVKLALMGLARNLEEEKDLVLLADEFCRFRNWYSLTPAVWVKGLEEQDKAVSLRDALTLLRMENLGGEAYEYSFDYALDFQMDQYTMTFADLIREEQQEGVNGEEAEEEPGMQDLDIPGIEYTDRIFTPEKLH